MNKLKSLNKTGILSQDAAKALYSVAYHFYQAGKYDDAIPSFRLLAEAFPSEKNHWMGLAASLQMKKNYQEAASAYSAAAVLDDADPEVHFRAAECFFALGQTTPAILALSSAEKLAKQNKTLYPLLDHVAFLKERWSGYDRSPKS